MLELKSLDAGYGSFQALFGVNLDVKAGEAVGVIGPNGAGKTTLMRVISGLIRPTRGTIAMEGTDVVADAGASHRRAGHRPRAGEPPPVPAAHRRGQPQDGRLHARRRARSSRKRLEFVFDLFPRMKERRNQMAGTMSGGEQQMCAIGRALMSRSQAAAARRAVGGPGAGRGAAGLRAGQAHPLGRAHRADRRAERAAGAEGRRSRLSAGGRHHPRLRQRGGDAGERPIKQAYLGV